MPSKRILQLVLGALALVVTIQFVPYGRDHDNPSVRDEPAWSSPEVRALAVRSCFDCHSNEVRWPWYSHVAPISWLIQRHAEEGRSALNFSDWAGPQPEAAEAAESVREGEMPLGFYVLMHPEARLSSSERQQLILGLEQLTGNRRE